MSISYFSIDFIIEFRYYKERESKSSLLSYSIYTRNYSKLSP